MPKPSTMTVCRATNIIRRAVRTYGEGPQMDMMIEEMSELTKAICKYRRGQTEETADAILEEMVDVQIMLDQMAVIFGDCTDWMDAKLERLEERMNRRDDDEHVTEV